VGLGFRLVGWITAYVFVLHALLAGATATRLEVNAGLAGAPGFETCSTSLDGRPLPGHAPSQHENCAIHCAVAGNLPPHTPAILALQLPQRSTLQPAGSFPTDTIIFAHRAGLSRAPPLHA
jgi:hypothetical protein